MILSLNHNLQNKYVMKDHFGNGSMVGKDPDWRSEGALLKSISRKSKTQRSQDFKKFLQTCHDEMESRKEDTEIPGKSPFPLILFK